MSTAKEIREFVMALPAVEEGPPVRAARRVAGFKVAGKSFLGIETGEKTVTLSLGEEARTLAAEHPDTYEAIWRDKTFMGLRIQLSRVPAARMRELIRSSWRHSAPKRIAEPYEKDRL